MGPPPTNGDLVRGAAIGLLIAVVAGCTADELSPHVSIDTLDNGRILVRNDSVGTWDSASAWKAVVVTRIGSEADSTTQFGGIAGLALDELGRVYVADRQANTISVFDSLGRRVRVFGRRGQGPGEFGLITGIAWGPGGALWVADPRNARYSLFDTAGRFLSTYSRSALGYAFEWDGSFDERGHLFEPSRSRGVTAYVEYRIDSTAATASADDEVGYRPGTLVPVDTFELPPSTLGTYRIEFARGSMIIGVPYAPRLVWRFDGRHGVWIANSDSYRLVNRSLDGDTVRIVERDLAPVSLTDAERAVAESSVTSVGSGDADLGPRKGSPADLSRIPAVKPAFETFVVDDRGYLWVARTADAGRRLGQPTVFDIFDPEGRFLGSLDLPIATTNPTPLIRSERAVGVAIDSLGVATILVYRLAGR
jgi:hypothetical protein